MFAQRVYKRANRLLLSTIQNQDFEGDAHEVDEHRQREILMRAASSKWIACLAASRESSSGGSYYKNSNMRPPSESLAGDIWQNHDAWASRAQRWQVPERESSEPWRYPLVDLSGWKDQPFTNGFSFFAFLYLGVTSGDEISLVGCCCVSSFFLGPFLPSASSSCLRLWIDVKSGPKAHQRPRIALQRYHSGTAFFSKGMSMLYYAPKKIGDRKRRKCYEHPCLFLGFMVW